MRDAVRDYVDKFNQALEIEINHLKEIGGTKYRVYEGHFVAKVETEWVYTFGLEVEFRKSYCSRNSDR